MDDHDDHDDDCPHCDVVLTFLDYAAADPETDSEAHDYLLVFHAMIGAMAEIIDNSPEELRPYMPDSLRDALISGTHSLALLKGVNGPSPSSKLH